MQEPASSLACKVLWPDWLAGRDDRVLVLAHAALAQALTMKWQPHGFSKFVETI